MKGQLVHRWRVHCRPKPTASTLSVRQDLLDRVAQAILLTDFFAAAALGSASNVSVQKPAADMAGGGWNAHSHLQAGFVQPQQQQQSVIEPRAAAGIDQLLPQKAAVEGGSQHGIARVLEAYAQAGQIKTASHTGLHGAGSMDAGQLTATGRLLVWRIEPDGTLRPVRLDNMAVPPTMMLMLLAATAWALLALFGNCLHDRSFIQTTM